MDLIFLSDIVLTVLALIALAIASYTDFKKREVANWISFSLIITAIIIRTIISVMVNQGVLSIFLSLGMLAVFLAGFFFLLKNERPWLEYVVAVIFIAIWFFSRTFHLNYLNPVFLFFGVFIIIANVIYYTKMSGGADGKILLALSVVFSTTPVFLIQNYNLYIPLFSGWVLSSSPFLFDFIVNSLFVGFVFGLVFSTIMALRNKKLFLESFKKLNRKMFLMKLIFIFFGFLFLVLALSDSVFFILGIALLIIPYLIVFVSAVQQSSMTKMKSWKELTEGDWIVNEVKIGGKVLKKTADGLTKKDILLIKKSGKKILVLDGMPYVPVFLISIIISLILWNLMFLLLEAMI